MHVTEILQVPAQNILDGGGGEEEFLPQPQFLPRRGTVVGIEHAHQRFSAGLVRQRARVIAIVECIEAQRIERTGRPQAQRVHAPALPADDRRIDRDRFHLFGRLPMRLSRGIGRNRAAETDFVGAFPALEFPRIAVREPGFGQFALFAIVLDPLTEHAVHVTDAVTKSGQFEAGEAFHEARREPAQPAIAQRCIGFEHFELRQIDAQLGQGRGHLTLTPEIGDGVAQQAPDQKFQAEIIDTLGTLLMRRPGGRDPALHHIVTHRENGRVEPVKRARGGFVLTDSMQQRVDDGGGQRTARAHVVGRKRRGRHYRTNSKLRVAPPALAGRRIGWRPARRRLRRR